MRISVVIPAYNAANWLEATLASVASQTHPADEVIVVDDGSTDATAAIAAASGARVISTPNRGLCTARNTGIERASGDWIALLDADDLWHPDKLARQAHAAALAPDAAIVATDHYSFVEEGRVYLPSILHDRRKRFSALDPQEIATGIWRLVNMGTRLVRLGMVFIPSTWLLRRDLVLAVGGFDDTFRYCEDYEFLLRVLARSDLLVVDAPLLGYRRFHASSLSRNAEAMTGALIQIGDALAARPERYAPGAAAAFAPRLREALVESAAFQLKRGESRHARALLARAAAIGRDPRWLALTLASRLPPRAIAVLSAAKRRLGLRR
jgi:glycosyltransferase involved in cell wall biosynthesis